MGVICHSLLPTSIRKSYYPLTPTQVVVDMGEIQCQNASLGGKKKVFATMTRHVRIFSVNEDYTPLETRTNSQIPSPSPMLLPPPLS
jgi:hypothetical protein